MTSKWATRWGLSTNQLNTGGQTPFILVPKLTFLSLRQLTGRCQERPVLAMDPWIVAFPFDPPDLAKRKFDFCQQHRDMGSIQISGRCFFFWVFFLIVFSHSIWACLEKRIDWSVDVFCFLIHVAFFLVLEWKEVGKLLKGFSFWSDTIDH